MCHIVENKCVYVGKESPIWACPNAMLLSSNCVYALCDECFTAKVGQFDKMHSTTTRTRNRQKCNHKIYLDPFSNPIHFDENHMQRVRDKGYKYPDNCIGCKRRIAVKCGYKNI